MIFRNHWVRIHSCLGTVAAKTPCFALNGTLTACSGVRLGQLFISQQRTQWSNYIRESCRNIRRPSTHWSPRDFMPTLILSIRPKNTIPDSIKMPSKPIIYRLFTYTCPCYFIGFYLSESKWSLSLLFLVSLTLHIRYLNAWCHYAQGLMKLKARCLASSLRVILKVFETLSLIDIYYFMADDLYRGNYGV